MTGIQLAPPPNPYSDQLAQALMQQGQIDGPIITPMQGIGKLAQALAGALLHKKYGEDKTAYEQQHSQAVNDALAKALGATNYPSIFGTEDPSKIPMPSDNNSDPLVAAFNALRSDPTTLEQSNQFGVQALMSQQKKDTKDEVTWRPLTQADKEKIGANPYQAIREKVVNGKPTGETEAVGSPQIDPNQPAKNVTTNTYADDGSYVKRVVQFNKLGDIVGTQDIPQVEKAMPQQEQNKVDAILKTSAISSVMRDILQAGAQSGWTGPVSGPLAIKMQNLGIDTGGTWAQAFAAVKDHYILAINGLVPQRGKWVLDTLANLGPKPQYSLERDLMNLNMTDGLVRNSAANTVQGFTNTGYHIDPTLFDLAKQGGFDPNQPHSAIKNYLPQLADQAISGNKQTATEGQTSTGKHGEQIVVKRVNGKLMWVDANTGNPYGG